MRRTVLSKKKVQRLSELRTNGLYNHTWGVRAILCEICGGESDTLSAAEDIALVRLCSDHHSEWFEAAYSLDWLNACVPNRQWEMVIRVRCPNCHAMKPMPDDDYICKDCRNED